MTNTDTVTPDAGEELRSFHVYTSISACDINHYYSLIIPAEFGRCGGLGLLLTPVYPVSAANESPTWGHLKTLYR